MEVLIIESLHMTNLILKKVTAVEDYSLRISMKPSSRNIYQINTKRLYWRRSTLNSVLTTTES